MKGHMHPESYRGFRELLKREVHIDSDINSIYCLEQIYGKGLGRYLR